MAMVVWYAISSWIPSGNLEASVAAYRKKHCTHVAKCGIIFLVCSRSAACTTIICPSRDWGMGLPFPLAGESSAKSMYSFARIFATSFFGIAANPDPIATNGEGGQFAPLARLLQVCWVTCWSVLLLIDYFLASLVYQRFAPPPPAALFHWAE